jgi:hypothetical protein
MLHSAADPLLCLAADPVRRTVALAGCVVHAGETFFDLTVRGELQLRQDGDLVVAPATGAATKVVVTKRDGAEAQRWVFDTGAGAAPPPGTPAPGEPSAPRTAPPLSRDRGPAATDPVPLRLIPPRPPRSSRRRPSR